MSIPPPGSSKAGEISHGVTFLFKPDSVNDEEFKTSENTRLIDWSFSGVSVGNVDMTDQQSKGGYQELLPGNATNAEITMMLKLMRGSKSPRLRSFGTLTFFYADPDNSDNPTTNPILSAYGWWSKIKDISGSHASRMTHSLSFQPTGEVSMNAALAASLTL